MDGEASIGKKQWHDAITSCSVKRLNQSLSDKERT
jgi:hypothetical protein